MKHLPTIAVATITAIAITILLFNTNTLKEDNTLQFNLVDTDQDGFINKDEAAQVPKIASIYKGADLDQDGKLDANEYERAKHYLKRNS